MVHNDFIMNDLQGSAAELPRNIRPTAPVTLYTTQRDVRSAKTRAWLEAHDIPYTDHDVVADSEALRQMITLSGSRRIPVVQIGDQVIVGFDEIQLEASLNERNGIEKGRLGL